MRLGSRPAARARAPAALAGGAARPRRRRGAAAGRGAPGLCAGGAVAGRVAPGVATRGAGDRAGVDRRRGIQATPQAVDEGRTLRPGEGPCDRIDRLPESLCAAKRVAAFHRVDEAGGPFGGCRCVGRGDHVRRFAGDDQRQVPRSTGHGEARAQRVDHPTGRIAIPLVPDEPKQHGEPDLQRCPPGGRSIERVEHQGAAVGRKQPLELRQQTLERLGVAKDGDHPGRSLLRQPARDFLPDPFGHQGVDLAIGHHPPHQRERAAFDGELGEAGSEPCDAQHADRIFDECGADVPEQPGCEVPPPAVRINEVARRLVLGHRIDRQVAALEVGFERDGRICVEFEAGVSRRHLSLGASERVLLVRPGMKKNREVAAHRLVAGGEHLVDGRADDDVIAVDHREAEQPVADRAADHVALHCPVRSAATVASVNRADDTVRRRPGTRSRRRLPRPIGASRRAREPGPDTPRCRPAARPRRSRAARPPVRSRRRQS